MSVFGRGVRLYLAGVSLTLTLAAVWGTNRFLLRNATVGDEWPLLVAVAVLLTAVGSAMFRLRPGSEGPLRRTSTGGAAGDGEGVRWRDGTRGSGTDEAKRFCGD